MWASELIHNTKHTHTHTPSGRSESCHLAVCVCGFEMTCKGMEIIIQNKRTQKEKKNYLHDSMRQPVTARRSIFIRGCMYIYFSLRYSDHYAGTSPPTHTHTNGSNQATYLPQPFRLSRHDIKQGRSDKPRLPAHTVVCL